MERVDYHARIGLFSHEKAVAKDIRTGEYRDPEDTGVVLRRKKAKGTAPEGCVVFVPDASFVKRMPQGWDLLHRTLGRLELGVAYDLARRAKRFTNSLEPLGEYSTLEQLMEATQLSRAVTRPVVNALLAVGFCGCVDDPEYRRFWALNPYLQFSGRFVKKTLVKRFEGTHIANAFYDEGEYRLGDGQLEMEIQTIRATKRKPLTRREKRELKIIS